MKFLVDENIGPGLSDWLRQEGYEVFSVHADAPGTGDSTLLKAAADGDWVVLTDDKDFGDLVYRDGQAHAGVVLFRFVIVTLAVRIEGMKRLFAYGRPLEGNYTVVEHGRIRPARTPLVPPTPLN